MHNVWVTKAGITRGIAAHTSLHKVNANGVRPLISADQKYEFLNVRCHLEIHGVIHKAVIRNDIR